MTSLTTVRLDSLGKVVTGSTPPAAHPEWFAASGVPFVTPSDLMGDQRQVRTQRFLSEVGAREMAKRLIPANAVCFVSIGSTIGKMCSTAVPSVTNQQINSLIVDESIADPTYIYYAISQISESLRDIAGGSATPILNKTTFASIELEVLPLPEQRAIGATLGALDDKIESNRRATAVGESLIRALVESALDASEGADGTLGDYCSLVKAPVKVEDISAEDNYIGLEHMPRGSIFLTEWEKAQGLGSNKTAFQRGDVLFGKLRPYFKKVGIAPVDGVCSTDILAVRPKDPRDIALIAVVAASDALIDSLSAGSTGTRMPRASWKDLAAWQVPILTSTERAELSARVAPLVDRLEQLTFESRRLTALRDALLPELLSGRIRVPAEGVAA